MSRTALFVTLIAAVLLGGGAVLVVGSKNNAAKPGATAAPIQPRPGRASDLRAISVLVPIPGIETGRGQRMLKLGDDGQWREERSFNGWPLDPRRVGELLQLLDAALLAPASETAPAPDGKTHGFVLYFPEPPTTLLEIGTTAVGGRVNATLGDSVLEPLPATALDVLSATRDIEQWRIDALLPDVEQTTLRTLQIDSSNQETLVSLARLDGRWRTIQPLPARADAGFVNSLIERLVSLRISAFADSVDERPEGEPRLVLTLTDRGPGSGEDSTWRVAIWPASSGSTPVDVMSPSGNASVLINGDLASSISTAPRNYLDPTASDLSIADISMLRLVRHDGSEEGYRRDLGAWTAMPSGDTVSPEPIEELLRFLTEEPLEPDIPSGPDDLRTLVRVELLDYAGEPLQILSVGYTADAQLAVRGQSVVWLAGGWRGPELLRIPPFDAVPPAPVHAIIESPQPVEGK